MEKWENFVFYLGTTIFIATMISISVDRYIVNACIVKKQGILIAVRAAPL